MKKLILPLLAIFFFGATSAHAGLADLNVGESIVANGLILTLALVFGAGVLVSLTPCVYPMVPITLSIIGARSVGQKPLISFLRSLVFVLGIAIIYSSLGLAAAKLKLNSSFLLQSAWFLVLISLFFMAMGVSMLGYFSIQLPAAFSGKLQHGANRGGFLGAFLLGVVTGIVASPCGSPVLVSVLLLASQSGNSTLGFAMLFAYALGIGLLFLILGSFPALIKTAPKSGVWMDDIKKFLGIVLIGVGIFYLRTVLPETVYWIVAAVAALAAGFVIAVKSVHRKHSTTLLNAWRLAGLAFAAFAVYVAVAKVPAAIAATKPMLDPDKPIMAVGEQASASSGQPLPAVASTDNKTSGAVPAASGDHGGLNWITDEAKALQMAKEQKKPVMVDFGAKWCVACVELEKHTFPDAAVKEALSKFILVRIDCTKSTPENQALQEKYKALSLPTVAFIGANGEFQENLTLYKFEDAAKFLERVKKVPQ
ncbi:MAG: thioredoxin family protein [Candidatus Sumerlaeaceae bacterium]|nr:thioredoxin family protein [Candidatus Sumerlaeaceae bacterium]